MATSAHVLQVHSDRRRARVDAQVAYEDAREELASLIVALATIGQRAAYIAAVDQSIELDPEEPLQSEAALLMLAPAQFEGIDFKAHRELGNAIVAARKQVAGKKALALALGCKL
jgi:hypothetical protein